MNTSGCFICWNLTREDTKTRVHEETDVTDEKKYIEKLEIDAEAWRETSGTMARMAGELHEITKRAGGAALLCAGVALFEMGMIVSLYFRKREK